MKKSYEHGELSKEILMAFLGGGLALTCVVLPGMAHIVKLFKPRSAKETYRLQRAFNNLRKQGYVMRRVRNGKEEFVVTQTGKTKLANYLAGDLAIQRTKKWDKKWRVVMFDIPNTKSKIRKEVSFKIKDMGMYPIQESVFVSPFPCKSEVDFLTSHYAIEKYFVYIEADVIESPESLIRRFNLNP